VERFARRADSDLAEPDGASFVRARDVLTKLIGAGAGPGTVLDVGAGAGAASLPLAPWFAQVVAVDPSPGMLGAFAERAALVGAAARTLTGRWPQVAADAGTGDLVVCHHVVYDVADIGPFLLALTAASSGRVVLEMTPDHPMSWLSPLWLRLHGLSRPTRPTGRDLLAVLDVLGVRDVTVDESVRRETPWADPADRVALVTRRLCLPVEAEPQVAAALADLPARDRYDVLTLTWAGSAPGASNPPA
jgi:SAM-dependent methyltransferase